MLCVTCHLSHVTNANSQSHSQGPPHYEQQDACADLELDTSTMSCEDPNMKYFCAGFGCLFEAFLLKYLIQHHTSIIQNA